jgi:hypothetical protein
MNKALGFAVGAFVLAVGTACSSSPSGEADAEEEFHIVTPFDDVKKDRAVPPGDAIDLAGNDSDARILPDVADGQGWDGDGTPLDVQEPDDGSVIPDVGDDGGTPDVSEVTVKDTYVDPVDQPFVTFGPLSVSAKGFVLSGKFVQFRFAEVDYWKFPASEWDRLLDMVKAAGFNGVATSACWRMHEPVQGQYAFAGDLDVAAFLDKVSARALYAYVAAGPYVDGEAAGCLPDWIVAGAANAPAAVMDGKHAPRTNDADYMAAVTQYFDQLNPAIAARLLTSFPQGPVVFYQLDSKVDLFYLLRDAEARISAEMQGVALPPQNPAIYLAQLRDAVMVDGIKVPLIVSMTGDFENGGRRIFATGDVPELIPAIDISGDSPYDPMELKLWILRKEMRNTNLHGNVYLAAPSIAVGLLPTPTHMARMLMAGADAVVVKGFAAAVLPPAGSRVTINRDDEGYLAGLKDVKASFGASVEDFPAALTPSGLPRDHFFGFRSLNYFMERFGPSFANRDLPYRVGANPNGSPFALKVDNPEVGAIEDKWSWTQANPAGGVVEVMEDHFAEWYQYPKEMTGRSTYFFDSSDGTLLVGLVNLDGLASGKNTHQREDLLTKIFLNNNEIPRHTSIVVPASDDVATGEPHLGWGHKIIPIFHPLGVGYPVMEYFSGNLAALREFNGRLLLVSSGRELVHSKGVFFTEPGEVSFSNLPGIPDITHNSLNGGGVHTDTNGRIAVSFQHDTTGFLVLSLGNGKQIQLMVTTEPLGRTVHFGQDVDVSDVAVFGMDSVESFSGSPEGLTIEGHMRAGADRLLLLTQNKPASVKVNGTKADCKYDAATWLVDCSFVPQAVPVDPLPNTGLYTRQENYTGSLSELGVDGYPDAFAQVPGAPLAANDPTLGVASGVMWYATDFQMGPVPPTQEGFFNVPMGSDIVSLFVNGTYVGTSVSLGNTPMKSTDVAMGMAAAGMRTPAGLLVEGTNTLAVRAVLWGPGGTNMPLIYSLAPLLPASLDVFATAVPHVAVKVLGWSALKGLSGNAKVSVGGVLANLTGTWTVSRPAADGMGRSYGMLVNWHNLPPDPSAAPNNGFASVPQPAEATPLTLGDGQGTWITTSFASASIPLTGGAELALEGKSAIALCFFNGTYVGAWASDEASLSQGLHSELLQGAGSRQILADLEYARFASSENTVPLPERLLKRSGSTDNRVTCLVMDVSPATDADAAVQPMGTIAGVGKLTRFELTPNTDRPGTASGPGQGEPLYWEDVTVEVVPAP